jgi:hypothetical protein
MNFKLFSIFVALFTLPIDSSSEELINLGSASSSISLNEAVAKSKVVAKIQILSIDPVLNNNSKDEIPCGFSYHAKVTQSLKGAEKYINFFMPLKNDSISTGNNYLAFLKYRSEEDARQIFSLISDGMSNSESYAVRCRFPPGYYIPINFPLIIPFDSEASRQFGGEWLTSKPGIIFCETKINSNIDDEKFSKRKKSGHAVINWNEVSRLIQKSKRKFNFFNKYDIDSCAN